MNISINLLPQRVKSKEGSLPVIPIAGAIAVIVSASFLIYTYLDTRSSVQALREQIVLQTEVRNTVLEEFLTKTTGITEYNYVDHFMNLDSILGSIYKSTIMLKEHLYLLLPDHAAVNSYTFVNNGELLIEVTFRSKGDAAMYLNRVLNTEVVSSAEVQTISTSDEDILYQAQFTLKLNTLAGEAT